MQYINVFQPFVYVDETDCWVFVCNVAYSFSFSRPSSPAPNSGAGSSRRMAPAVPGNRPGTGTRPAPSIPARPGSSAPSVVAAATGLPPPLIPQ